MIHRPVKHGVSKCKDMHHYFVHFIAAIFCWTWLYISCSPTLHGSYTHLTLWCPMAASAETPTTALQQIEIKQKTQHHTRLIVVRHGQTVRCRLLFAGNFLAS